VGRLDGIESCVRNCCWVYSDDATAFSIDFNSGTDRELAAYGSAPFYEPGTVQIEVRRPFYTGLVTAKVTPDVIARDGTVRLQVTSVTGKGSLQQKQASLLTGATGNEPKHEYFAKRRHGNDYNNNAPDVNADPSTIPRLKPQGRLSTLVKPQAAPPAEDSPEDEALAKQIAGGVMQGMTGMVKTMKQSRNPIPAPVPGTGKPREADDLDDRTSPGYSKSAVVKFAQERIEPLVKLEFDSAAKTAVQNGFIYKAGTVGWTVKNETGLKYRLYCNFYAEMGKTQADMTRRMYPCGIWLANMKTNAVSPLDERAKKIWN